MDGGNHQVQYRCCEHAHRGGRNRTFFVFSSGSSRKKPPAVSWRVLQAFGVIQGPLEALAGRGAVMVGLDDKAAESLTRAFVLQVKGRVSNIGRALVLEIMGFVSAQLTEQTESIVDALVVEPMDVLRQGFATGSATTVIIAKEEFAKAKGESSKKGTSGPSGPSGLGELKDAALKAVAPTMEKSKVWVKNVSGAVKVELKKFPTVLKTQMKNLTTETKGFLRGKLYESFKTQMVQLACDAQSFLVERLAEWTARQISSLLTSVNDGSNGLGTIVSGWGRSVAQHLAIS